MNPIEKTKGRAILKAKDLLRAKHKCNNLFYTKVKHINGRCYCGETEAIEVSAEIKGVIEWTYVNICKHCADE